MNLAHAKSQYRLIRLRAFATLVWRRFFDDRCFAAAGALSYTTVFALVPVTMATVGIMAAFPVFETWSAQASDFFFANFVPSAARTLQEYLSQFAANASKLTGAGVVGSLISAVMMLGSVEETFNQIWRVPARSNRLGRFFTYWSVLTFGPILIAVSVGVAIDLLSRVVDPSQAAGRPLWPIAVSFFVFLLVYLVVPNASVRLRHALAGALLATVMFEGAKRGFSLMLLGANYEKVYGALASAPIVLIWIYVSWLVVLLGASLVASLGAFRFDSENGRWPAGLELLAVVRVLRLIRSETARGHPPGRELIGSALIGASADQVDAALERLRRVRAIEGSLSGGFVPLRDPALIPLAELFPEHPPRCAPGEWQQVGRDASDAATVAWLEAYRLGTETALATPLAQVLDAEPAKRR